MNHIQQKIFANQSLTQDESFQIFDALIKGNLSEIEMTSLLVSLKMKGEQPSEIAGAAMALRQAAEPFINQHKNSADSCGTGGSGMNTVNISTMVAIILAEMGLPMVKHGNRSVSSKCGSADVLERLGVKIDMVSEQASQCLDQHGFCFLFAPLFHLGVGNVMPVRKTLQTRTIFNLLGPLINPAKPNIQLMGVYSPELCHPAAETLKIAGCQSAMVVHSHGYDEITLHSKTNVSELNQGKITEYQLDHSDFGLAECQAGDITGNDPEENAAIFEAVLKGQLNNPQLIAIANTVAANAAALLKIAGMTKNLKTGASEVLSVIHSGKAYQKLQNIVQFSQIEFNAGFSSECNTGSQTEENK